jgi:hypothetical protein
VEIKNMAKYARILNIENNRVMVGLLNDKGLCGSGTCEGCSCSTKMQTMTVNVNETEQKRSYLKTGIDVEMILPSGTVVDWFLLIFLPVILVVATAILLKDYTETLRNTISMISGISGFLISAVILKFLRKDQTIELVPLSEESRKSEI